VIWIWAWAAWAACHQCKIRRANVVTIYSGLLWASWLALLPQPLSPIMLPLLHRPARRQASLRNSCVAGSGLTGACSTGADCNGAAASLPKPTKSLLGCNISGGAPLGNPTILGSGPSGIIPLGEPPKEVMSGAASTPPYTALLLVS